MGGKSVLLLWVVKVCHYIRVVKISGEKMNGGQKKLGGTFQGGKKVAAFFEVTIEVFSDSLGGLGITVLAGRSYRLHHSWVYEKSRHPAFSRLILVRVQNYDETRLLSSLSAYGNTPIVGPEIKQYLITCSFVTKFP